MKKEKETVSKPKYNMWQCAAYMIQFAWREKEKKVLVLCLLQVFLAVASNLVNLYVSPCILSVVEQRAPFSTLMMTILLFCGLILLCSAATSYVNSNTLYGRVTVRTAVIAAMNKKCCTTSYPNLSDEKFVKLRSKSQQAVGNNQGAAEAIWTTLTELMQNGIGFILYLFLLVSLDLWLILILLLTALTGYFVNKRLTSYGYRHREEEGEISTKLWYQIEQARNCNGAKDIRIFGMKPWIEEISAKALRAYHAFHRRANNRYIWGSILDLVLALVRNGLAYVFLIHMVLTNGMSVSAFLLYFSAINGFTAWLSGILASMTTLYRQSLDLSTIREFLEYPEPFLFEKGKALLDCADAPHELTLENVSFRYPGAENETLTGINLTIHPGEKIAVVGLNGAGKTTLVKLICGFFDPTSGRVLLDGQDIRTLNRQDYYQMFSAVFQDFSLLAGTIATNVAQTQDHQDMDRVKECVEKAGLRAKVDSLKEGYQTYLNRTVYDEAIELSGGEMQKLMLARALYKKGPFIILDEPTAALDPIAEAQMYSKYNEMTQDRTSIYISHRLASTRFCDRILLISNHKIAEEGTHEQLLERCGEYAKLFEIQSKYY